MGRIAEKRIHKIKGFLKYFCSLVFLKYTALHRNYLKSYFKVHPVTKLHIGCGHVKLKGWLNIFFEKSEFYGLVESKDSMQVLNYDLLKEWPFADGSIECVAGSHIIEHFDLNAGLKLIGKAYRVLKPGGIIRLSCPDLELYAKNYLNGNKDFYNNPKIREWCAFKQAETFGEIFAAKAYDSGGAHKWFYDFDSLKHILEKHNFRNIRKVGRLEGKTPDVEKIELADRELETVYIEAEK